MEVVKTAPGRQVLDEPRTNNGFISSSLWKLPFEHSLNLCPFISRGSFFLARSLYREKEYYVLAMCVSRLSLTLWPAIS